MYNIDQVITTTIESNDEYDNDEYVEIEIDKLIQLKELLENINKQQ